jgi:hypothetical protein
VGLAVLATMSSSRTHQLAASGHGQEAALLSGYHLAFWIAAGLMIVAIAVAAKVLTRPAAVPPMAAETDGAAEIAESGETAESGEPAADAEPARGAVLVSA